MKPNYDFQGQVALVTGAASGMGLGTAKAFAVKADRAHGARRGAEEIADAVLRLCSPASNFVVGVALPVDGGFVVH